MVNVGIIGYGYWGPNLVRNFFKVNGCHVKTVADSRSSRQQELRKIFPTIKAVNDGNEIIQDLEIDAIVIATPVCTHFKLAHMALLKGKHVLIEKPMTSTVAEAEILISLAEQKNLLLMVDHTFLYTGAVQKMKQLVDKNELGSIQYMDSTRINLGLFQSDINVLWDLAPHDLSILSFIVNERPYSVNARGITHTSNKIENIAYLTVNFASGLIAHFNCSWTSPVKVRMMLIGGDQKMILYNDLETTEKIKIYDSGYSCSNDKEKEQVLVDYRVGDIHVPKIDTTEALFVMANDFISSIQEKKQPLSSCYLGLEVVRILEASNESIKHQGREVVLQASAIPFTFNSY